MSTRAYIGIRCEDGKIKAIYNHGDGYLRGLGNLLVNHFVDTESVNRLICLGYVSCIQSMETYQRLSNSKYFKPSEWIEMQGCMVCSFGHSEDEIEYFNSVEEMIDFDINWAYLFAPEEERWYCTHGDNTITLTPAIVKNRENKDGGNDRR